MSVCLTHHCGFVNNKRCNYSTPDPGSLNLLKSKDVSGLYNLNPNVHLQKLPVSCIEMESICHQHQFYCSRLHSLLYKQMHEYRGGRLQYLCNYPEWHPGKTFR